MARPENKLAFDGGWEYAPAPESTDHVRIDKRYGLFIDGEFVAPEKGRYFDSINPATEEKLSRVAEAGPADVDKAVRAAREAYRKTWSKMKPAERGKYIFRIARIMQERAREFAAIESLDGGTLLIDRVRYALPLAAGGPLGDALHSLCIRPSLERIFDYRREVFASLFGAPAPTQSMRARA